MNHASPQSREEQSREEQDGRKPLRARSSGSRWFSVVSLAASSVLLAGLAFGDDPPNPFGKVRPVRSDAVAGAMQLSDGRIITGHFYLTRAHKLRIYDTKRERVREVPLRAVREINAVVKKKWMEHEWRFKANADNEKVYTGRTYPSRIYLHDIKLKRGDTIRGSLAALVYVEPNRKNSTEAKTPNRTDAARPKPQRYMLHKRDKGKPGQALKDLIYVRRILFGPEAETRLRHKPHGGSTTSRRQK